MAPPRRGNDGRSRRLDPQASQRLRHRLDATMQQVNEAQETLRQTDVVDDEAAVGLTQLIDDLVHKQEGMRQELGTYGMAVPAAPTGMTDALTGNIGGQGRRLQYERQMGDVHEACNQLREALDSQDDRGGPRGGGGRGGGGPVAHYEPPEDVEEQEGLYMNTAMSHGAAHDPAQDTYPDDDIDDLDDGEEHNGGVMTPRGVYVQRCLPMTKFEIQSETETFTAWFRTARVSVLGLLIFLLYLAASGGYIFSRIFWSLDGLGSELWYGWVVLVAEILSILSLVFYGVYLCARTDNTDMRVTGDSDRMRRAYVVRVFILCRDEGLSLVRRTIASVRNAYLPEGCEIKIYLLDDRKDPAKRDFFMSAKAGTDVIYIAPPVRLGDEKVVNWRSSIMNFTLALVYPKAHEEGLKNIPMSELVCVVTADQTASSSFFINLIRYMDSGDDIGVAMNPRICYNVDPDCDIFDHQKVAYCEKQQLGMDAYGFTVCMSNNLLLRARALQEIGWFPPDTLSENWEIGMQLRAFGWKSRYVPEYSAIGEAPTEICHAFEEHYAVSRGYFQTFWSSSCPLLNRDLGIFYRLMYSSRCFKNFASGIWTFIFTFVPIIQLIAGYFPLSFNFWIAVWMTAHYVLRAAMLFLSDNFKQMRALWLARVNVSLMWWTDVKASFLTPAKAAMGSGTSFKGRAWSESVTSRDFNCLIWAMVITIISIIAFIGGCVHLGRIINLPTVLSLCLVVINIAPPLLLILYWNFGPGQFLARCCSLLMVTSFGAFITAICFLWILYPREVDYQEAAKLSLSYLDSARSGRLSPEFPVNWRKASGLQNQFELAFVNGTSTQSLAAVTVDLSGGFYNDGEVGPVKVTWNVAMTTTMLAWSLLEYPDFWTFNSTLLQNHAVDLLVHGARYIQSCYQITPVTDPVTGKRMKADNDFLYYAVGIAEQQRQLWNRPEDIPEQQFAGALSLSASPSDLAGQVTAALVSAALALKQYEVIDGSDASSLVTIGHRLFRSAVFSPGLYTEAFNGTDTGLEENYPSAFFGDDLFWASTWLFRAASTGIRTFNRTYYTKAMEVLMDLAYSDLDVPGTSWDYVNNIAVTHAATLTQDGKYHGAAQSFIWDWMCDDEQVKYTRNGRAFFFRTPHLGSTAAAAAMSAVYIKASKDTDIVRQNAAMIKGMQCFAVEQARYLLGGQVTGLRRHKPFLVGYGDNFYTRTWHRGASCPAYPDACDISVAYSGEPDHNVLHGALLWNPIFDDFPSDARGRNTTVVSLENNFALPLLFPAVNRTGLSYSDCLNGQETAFVKRAFCRQPRPQSARLGPREAVVRLNPEFQGLWEPKETPDRRTPPPPPPAPRPLVPIVNV